MKNEDKTDRMKVIGRGTYEWIDKLGEYSSILVMLTGVLSVNAVSLYGKKRLYSQQEAELRAQISEEQARAEEVKAYEEYVKTDEYIKDVAEEKLGLVDPNEIIFKPAE